MSSNKVNKKRGHSTNGRGYKKHKSGAKGGVGRAGIWSHNKNARKFKTADVRNFDHYLRSSILSDLIEHLRSSAQPTGTECLFSAGGKTHVLRDYDTTQGLGTFEIDPKFKKVLRGFTSESIPSTYKIVHRTYSQDVSEQLEQTAEVQIK